jgi:hypothetical protein
MRRSHWLFLLTGCAALALPLGAAMAQTTPPAAPRAPAQAPAQPAVDPVMEAAQKHFDALPEAERKAIQNDLIWGSDFTATVSGGFGRLTFNAIVNFQKAAKLRPDGILDPAGRKRLADAAAAARTAAKFAQVTDPKTGASLGIPAAAFTKRETTATGTRWSTQDNAVQLETAVAAGGAGDLQAAFDRLVTLAAPGRKVTYKLLRPDFFVVSGEHGPRSFYTRYGVGPTSLRGYTMSYPTAQAKQVERILIAIANSFQPIPGASGVAAAPPAGGQPTPPPLPETWPAGLFQTGVVVAPGKVATAAKVDACPEIAVNRRPARIAAMDKQSGLAILDAEVGQARPLRFAAAGPTKGDETPVIVGFGLGSPGPALTVSSGALVAGASPRVIAPLAREAAGSAVFDRHGGFIGVIAAPDGKPRLVAGLVPAPSHRIVPASALAKAAGAAEQPAPGGAAQSAGAIAAAARASLVAVECAKPFPR